MKPRPFVVLCLLLTLGAPVSALAAEEDDDTLSIEELLQRVKQGRLRDAGENQRREQEFLAEKDAQEAKIRVVQERIARLEGQSEVLEAEFNANELLIREKRQQRGQRLGAMQELFGHLTGIAGDMRSRFRNSITTSQFGDREEFLSELIRKMSSETELPSLEEMERVWFELYNEMVQSGRVVKYLAQVGIEGQREVVRVGLFNLISQGQYLAYDADTRSVSVLARQPRGLAGHARALQEAGEGVLPLGIDPTGPSGGGFLKAIINTPTLEERWHQGRQVGYIITGIGILALLVALLRFIFLGLTAIRIQVQMGTRQISRGNPLGRILQVAEAHRGDDTETLQLKLDEAILKETPRVQLGLAFLRIIAMVAPLLGLLGTVTGMIIVFQAITIYGAGDPRAMAGGISSALVTTVLGLIVAIPILLLHAMLSARARRILHILEEQSAGIVAERAERDRH